MFYPQKICYQQVQEYLKFLLIYTGRKAGTYNYPGFSKKGEKDQPARIYWCFSSSWTAESRKMERDCTVNKRYGSALLKNTE